MNEPRRSETGKPLFSRFKSGLETPLQIRFLGEDDKVVFAPPLWYDRLVTLCFVVGVLLVVSVPAGIGSDVFFDPVWRLWTGVAIVLAGTWAALSNERMVCDVKKRTYSRWEGKGPFKSLSRGSVSELDAIVLLAESTFGPVGPMVVYRLVLHWKNSSMPLLVVRQLSAPLNQGAPLNYASSGTLAEGQRVSKALGVPFYDNSYFHSPEPLRPI